MASEERPPPGAPSPNPTPNPTPLKAFSLSLGASKPKQPLPSRKPPAASSAFKDGKRRHVNTLSDSEDEDTASSSANQPQLVSAFDHSAGGAIGVDDIGRDRGPLVIPSQKNRDWREESKRKRGKNLLPPEAQAKSKDTQVAGDAGGEAINGGVQAYGLTFVERTAEEKDGDVDMLSEQAVEAKQQVAMPREKTDDELALEALTSHDGTMRSSNLVLPFSETQRDYNHRVRGSHISEDDAYRLDVASRPDPATLDDYAAVPVEEFGAALLRGMGWKEGDVVGKRKDQVSKLRVVERRPALLGIGAKEVPGGVGEELGAWGKGAKKRDRVIDKTYNPVVLRNSKTGETLTEEELKTKKEEYERAQRNMEEDWRERRDRNLGRDLERKEGRNGSRGSSRSHQDSDRDRHHHHHHSHRRDRGHRDQQASSRNREHSRRERSRSSDSRHRRRRDGEGDYDSDRRDRDRDSRDRRQRDDGDDDEGRVRDVDRKRRDRDRDRGESSGDSPRHRERERYEEEKTRRRQEVF